MFVKTQGYITEFQLENYLNYANKTNEIKIVNLGSKRLYQIWLNNLQHKNNNSIALVTNHKSSLDSLLASYGQEVLVNVKGKQVRRLQLDINQVNYKHLQDQLLGDFVFIDNNSKQLVIVDVIDYAENSPNTFTTKYIRSKLMKLKKRCHLFKAVAKEVTGKGSQYLSIIWNGRSENDLLKFIEQCNEENQVLRHQYKKVKAVNNLTEVAKILTQIHVKTNIDLDNLTFDVTEGIY